MANGTAALAALVADDIRTKVRDSYLTMLHEYILACDIGELPKEAEPFMEAVRRAALIPPDADADETLCQQLADNRKDLIEALRTLGSLQLYMDMLNACADTQRYAFDPERPEPEDDGEALCARFLDSITVEPSPKEKNGKTKVRARPLAALMAAVPLRLTTARYHDYIRDALRVMADKERYKPEHDYKKLFCPMRYLDGCRWAADLKAACDSLWERDAPPRSFTEAEAFADQAEDIADRLEDCFSAFSCLFDATVAAYIVQRYGAAHGCFTDADECAGLYQEFSRFHELSADGRRHLEDALQAAVDRLRGAMHFGPLDDAFDTADEEELPEELKRLNRDWTQLHTLYYEGSYDYTASFSVRETDKTVEAAPDADALTAFMEECTAGLPNRRRRFLRQHFLGFLLYPYSIDVFSDYFIDAYNSLDEAGKTAVCAAVDVYAPHEAEE